MPEAGAPSGTGGGGFPPSLPEQVPNFVSDIMGTIDSFLSGTLDTLGRALSGIASGADPSAVLLPEVVSVVA